MAVLVAKRGHGVVVERSRDSITIRGNSIHDNKGRGIDLVDVAGDYGDPPINDRGDGDGGANFLQNFPVVTGMHS